LPSIKSYIPNNEIKSEKNFQTKSENYCSPKAENGYSNPNIKLENNLQIKTEPPSEYIQPMLENNSQQKTKTNTFQPNIENKNQIVQEMSENINLKLEDTNFQESIINEDIDYFVDNLFDQLDNLNYDEAKIGIQLIKESLDLL